MTTAARRCFATLALLAVAGAALAVDGELDPSFHANGIYVDSHGDGSSLQPAALGGPQNGWMTTVSLEHFDDEPDQLHIVRFVDFSAGGTHISVPIPSDLINGEPILGLQPAGIATSLLTQTTWMVPVRVLGPGFAPRLGLLRDDPISGGTGFSHFAGIDDPDAAQSPVGAAAIVYDLGTGPETRWIVAVNEIGPSGSTVAVRRFSGTLDERVWPATSNHAVVFADTIASGVVADPQGRILVYGERNDLGWIARLLPTGELDPGFGTGGIVELALGPGDIYRDAVARVRAAADGRIALLGVRRDPDNFTRTVLGHLDDMGALVPGFGTNGLVLTSDLDVLAGIAIQDDRRTIAAGLRLLPDGVGVVVLVIRFLPDGSLDPEFGSGGELVIDLGRRVPPQDFAVDVALQAGRPVIFGSTLDDNGPDLLFARLTENLIFSSSFDSGTLAGWTTP